MPVLHEAAFIPLSSEFLLDRIVFLGKSMRSTSGKDVFLGEDGADMI